MPDILFLAHRVPYPPNRGDKMRSFHMLRHLAGEARIHLGAFADDDADLAYAEALRPLVATLHIQKRGPRLPLMLGGLARALPLSVAAFASADMQRFVDRTLASRRINAILAFSSQMAQFVPEAPGCRFVMDFVDMDSAKFAAYAAQHGGPKRWLHAREAALLQAFEIETARRADLSLFVSEAEAALFRGAAPGADVAALSNGIDLAFYDPATPRALAAGPKTDSAPLIVFTGQMDYPPNVEAVTLFARETLPRIHRAVPDARFVIVGRTPTAAVRALARDGVVVTGAVDDVRGWLAAADVVVAPLRLARGIQNKVLEAMAMAKPVVASPAAFEGIAARAGEELIVVDGVEAEAAAVIALLGDPARARAIGAAARARVEARYGWDATLAPLAALVGIAPLQAAAE